MPQPQQTSTLMSRPSKRQRKQEVVEPSKRQRKGVSQIQLEHQQKVTSGNAYTPYNEYNTSSQSLYANHQPTQALQAGYRSPQHGEYPVYLLHELETAQYGQAVHQQPEQYNPVAYQGDAAAHTISSQGQTAQVQESLEESSAPTTALPTLFTFSNTDDSAQKKLFTLQKRWLQASTDDLHGPSIATVPGINAQYWSLGDKNISEIDLVPSLVWRLRSFSPSERFVAYQYLILLARKMVKHAQQSKEYQELWTALSTFRAHLIQHERDWVAKIKTGTKNEKLRRLLRVGQDQAADTAVTQAMIDAFNQYQKQNLPVQLETHQTSKVPQTQMPVPDQEFVAQGQEKQERKAVPTALPRVSLTTAAITHSTSQTTTVKPDKIKFSSDLVPVPEYLPDNISYYTPNQSTGMYKCRHAWETKNRCCREGLTQARMRSSILKDITCWRGRVEKLIDEGKLDPRHKTWRKTYNAGIKLREQVAAEQAARRKAKEEEEKRAEQAEKERRRQKLTEEAARYKEAEDKRLAGAKRRQEEKSQKQLADALTAPHKPATLTRRLGVQVQGNSAAKALPKAVPSANASALKKHAVISYPGAVSVASDGAATEDDGLDDLFEDAAPVPVRSSTAVAEESDVLDDLFEDDGGD